MTPEHTRIHDMAQAYAKAWNTLKPEAVAACYAEDGEIVINRGTPWRGRAGIAQMAAGFYADVPDITVLLDELRIAGDHVAFFWTFTGTHARTGRALRVKGWEEWDLDAHLKVKASRGWYDAADYARQVENKEEQNNKNEL